MRTKGRRVAILLATALPLLALHESGKEAYSEASREIRKTPLANADENDSVAQTVAQAIHPAGQEQTSSEALKASDTIIEADQTIEENVSNKVEKNDDKNVNEQENDQDSTQQKMEAEDPSGSSSLTDNENEISSPRNSSLYEIKEGPEGGNSSLAMNDKHDETIEAKTSAENSTDQDLDGTTNNTDSSEDFEAEEGTPTTSEEKNNTVESSEEESTVLDEDEFKLRGRVAVDYASKSAGALVIEKSGSFKGTSNLLNGDRDKYAIAPCEEKKFVIVSLSEDILVKEIKLANYERFSSTAKDFQVMGSQTMDTWVDLGTYTAEPGNGEQLFELVDPAWARYLKFKFLSYHGDEYYCTYSQVKVHGSTMVQGFHEQWEESEETEFDADSEEADVDDEKQAEQNEALSKALLDTNTKTSSGRQMHNTVNNDASETADTKDVDPPCSNEQPVLIPSVSHLSVPSELNEILQGSVNSEDMFYQSHELMPGMLSNMSPTSRESVGRRKGGSRMLSIVKQSDLSRQATRASLNSLCRVDGSISTKSSGVISTPKMSDGLDKTTRKILERFSGANSIPIGLYDEPMNLKADTNSEASEDSAPVSDDIPDFPGAEKEKETGVESDPKDDTEETAPKDAIMNEKTNKTIDDTQAPAGAQETPSSDPEKIEKHAETPLGIDASLARLLQGLPSAECLAKLDFTDFKAKALRRATSGTGAANVASMEPIFKKLTDEIKALQTNLSIQDQFTKASVVCYQRVLFDLMFEMEKLRNDQDARISKLESELHSADAFAKRLFFSLTSLFSTVYSTVFAWNSLLIDCWFELCLWFSEAFYHSCSTMLKYFIQIWPETKKAIVSSSFGLRYANNLSPVLDQVERLVEYADGFDDHPFLPERTIQILPLFVPLFVIYVLYRLVMSLRSCVAREPTAKRRNSDTPSKHKINHSTLGRNFADYFQPEDYPELCDEIQLPGRMNVMLKNRG